MRQLLTLFLALWVGQWASAKPIDVETIDNGNVVCRVQFYAPTIVRIVKYPSTMKEMPKKESFSVIMTPEKVALEKTEANGKVEWRSTALRVSVDKQTCQVTFRTADGTPLLTESRPATFEMRSGDADAGHYIVGQTFELEKDECIFGLGQRQDKDLNQRGKHVKLWNTNTNITIPYFTSEKGYGLFWDNMGLSFFDDDETGTRFRSEVADMTDYYLMYADGTQDGVVAQIRKLTGQATMFPLWAMGYWQCRERYKTSDELAGVLDHYRELEVPLDAIVQDWQYWGCDSNWNAMRFMNPYYINKVDDPTWAKYLPGDMRNMKSQGEPRLKSPQEMVDYVHAQDVHLMISIWANFGPWTDQYKELQAIGALLPFESWPRNSGTIPYDPFNPKARDIYWKYLTNLYRMGFDAWWTDSTEPDHFEKPGDDDYKTYLGTWRSVKNAFALVHNKGIYEHQRKMKDNKKRILQMTRSGQFGLQHYGAFSWSGDVSSTWETMKNQIPSGLNYTICGIPFWNTDLGGFFGWDFNNDPKSPAMQELQVRWMQWGTFMPLMRNHCSSPMVNEIYEFGKAGEWAYDVQKQFIQLRYRLLPYIYSVQGDVTLNSGTMMRPLVMDFAKDRRAIARNDEYMFGRSLLVKPVTDPLYTWKDNRKKGHLIYQGDDIRKISAPVKVYLPAGTDWYDFWTNKVEKGGEEIMRPCPIQEMPVYVKAGSILPWGQDVQHSGKALWDGIEIRIYPGADGTFSLYEDEGDGYGYERGQYATTTFRWDDANRQLTLCDRQGSYKGMSKNRTFHIVVVNGEKKTIDYQGKEMRITLQ